VIGLHGVGQALEIDHGLVELSRVGRIVVSGRRVGMRGSPGIGRSEVPDHVHRTDQGIISGGENRGPKGSQCVGIAVEGIRVERPVVADFRSELDLRREPVLQPEAELEIAPPSTDCPLSRAGSCQCLSSHHRAIR
jgi:hypothetical protein